jgi:hypothetical protein
MDPLAEKYPWMSPYAYCANNPVKYIDPDGRKIVFATKTSQFTYNGKGLVNSNGTAQHLPANSHVGKVVNAYNKILNSGDKVLSGKVNTLINSENTHYVKIKQGDENKVAAGKSPEVGSSSTTKTEDKRKVEAGEGIGTTTTFNLSDEEKSRVENKTGVEHSDASIVAHEMQHQYDYDRGNMKDSQGVSGAKSPAEIRAVNTENRMRQANGSEMRTKYRGESIEKKELEIFK